MRVVRSGENIICNACDNLAYVTDIRVTHGDGALSFCQDCIGEMQVCADSCHNCGAKPDYFDGDPLPSCNC